MSTVEESPLDEIRKKYDDGVLQGVPLEPKADALVANPFYVLDDRGDPAQLKDWTLSDFWIGRSGRLYHDTETPGRPKVLFQGLRTAAGVRTRILRPNECVRDHALEISEEGGDAVNQPPVLIAAQEEEHLDLLVEAILAFRVDQDPKAYTFPPKAKKDPRKEPPTPGERMLSSPTRLRPATPLSGGGAIAEEEPGEVEKATIPAPGKSPEEEKLAMAKRRALQDSLLNKYSTLAKSLDGKRHLARDELAKHKHEKGRAVWAEGLGITQHNEFLQRCGAFRDKLSDEGDDFFDGEFHHGMRHGRGRWEFLGSSYEGVWRFDKPDGQGTFVEADGTSHKGEWRNGHLHGHGVICDPHGNVTYDGTFNNGRRDGLGRQVFENGDEYSGNWKDGRMHGRGTQSFRNGDKYMGMWEYGVYHGDGVFYFADGSFSRRSYVQGRLEETQDYKTEVERFQPIYTRHTMLAHTSMADTPIWAKGMELPAALRY